MKKIVLLTGFTIAMACACPVSAQTYTQDFEHASNAWFHSPVMGAACDGSVLDVSTARAHSGTHSGHVSYKFSARGNVQFASNEYPIVANAPGKLHLSMWIYGCGQQDFPNGGALVLSGSDSQSLLYWLGKPFGDALDGSQWTHFEADIDLTKPTGHWGGSNDGVAHAPLRFGTLGLDHFPDAAAQGDVFIDDLSISSDAPATASAPKAAAVSATLNHAGMDAAGFYAPGTPVSIAVRSNAAGNATWVARDFDGKQIDRGSVSLDASGTGVITLAVPKPGFTTVDFTAGDSHATAEFGTATPRPALSGAPSPILYGISTHLNGLAPDFAEREVAAFAALGFRACRFDINWAGLQPERGAWNWDVYDRIFALLTRYHIEPAPVLGYSTRWAVSDAVPGEHWQSRPPNVADYAAFAGACAKRYGRVTRYWEIWNEPDIASWQGSAPQYAALFSAASAAIKSVEPTALVMNGGFSEMQLRPTFITDYLAASATRPDMLAYHSHGELPGMLRASKTIRGDLKAAGWNMPIWLNEAGFTSTGERTPRDQALALFKKMTTSPALGDDAYFWYEMRDDWGDRSNSESNYGLTRPDLIPKVPALAAYVLNGTLDGTRFICRIDVPHMPNVYAMLYGRKNGGVVCVWNEAESEIPLLWRVPGQARQVSMVGEQTALHQTNGVVSLSASPTPCYLSFDGDPQKLNVIEPLLSLPPHVISVPGERRKMSITVQNPLSARLSGNVTFSANGWGVEPSTAKVDIAPGHSVDIAVTVIAPDSSGARSVLDVRLASPSLPDEAHSSVKLSGATVVHRAPSPVLGELPQSDPVAVLSQANIVSLFEAAPLENLRFHGDDDLSAKIYVSRVPEGLRLSVRVRDDIHCQDEPKHAEWQGDSIQFAIALPTGESYEWTAALTGHGPITDLDVAPMGVSLGYVSMPLSIRRDETAKETLYDLVISEALPGGAKLPDRFSMTLLVNDNDGGGRKGWAEWTPGIGHSKDPSMFRPIVVR